MPKPNVSKPSILIIGNFLSQSSSIQSVGEELAKQLSGAGWTVITASHRTNRLLRLLDMVSTIWQRRDEYSMASVEVYSGRAFLWAEVACWALRIANKPYLLTLHGGDLPKFAHRWPGRLTRLLGGAAVVTAPSAYLIKQMQPYRADLQLIPNAIDLSRYHFRQRLQPIPFLVWLRAFHYIYNPLMAVEVLASLRREFPDATLAMIGPDKGDGSLQAVIQRVNKLGLDDAIEIPGPISKDKVPEWLDRGDIFINTTNVDNTPVTVLEAMACGMCVVSTNVGGIPYLLENEIDSILISKGDARGMTLSISSILKDQAFAQQLSDNAHQRVKQFGWEHILPKWEALFRETTNKVNG